MSKTREVLKRIEYNGQVWFKVETITMEQIHDKRKAIEWPVKARDYRSLNSEQHDTKADSNAGGITRQSSL